MIINGVIKIEVYILNNIGKCFLTILLTVNILKKW